MLLELFTRLVAALKYIYALTTNVEWLLRIVSGDRD